MYDHTHWHYHALNPPEPVEPHCYNLDHLKGRRPAGFVILHSHSHIHERDWSEEHVWGKRGYFSTKREATEIVAEGS